MTAPIELVGNRGRVAQGDIYPDVRYLEDVRQEAGQLVIAQVIFPYVYVLTQDCDLDWDHKLRSTAQPADHDKHLVSVIVAPVYLAQHVREGVHLDQMTINPEGGSLIKMARLNSEKWGSVASNQNLRYHHLDFDVTAPLQASVIDFKHHFSVPVAALNSLVPTCCLGDLHRASVSQRFAAYLSRIGLPEAQPG